MKRLFVFVFAALLMPAVCHAQATLTAVLGASTVAMDSAKAQQVRAGTPGQRFYFDTNSDGKMDECWFIDIDPRHSKTCLIKVVDTAGDMAVGKEPDHANDIYISDTSGDNVADHAIFYEDYDKDGDMDAMAMDFGSYWWWAIDDGDDNCLWFDRNYTYDQNSCQDQCGFGADESFFAVQFFTASQTFYPRYEAPFLFWDNNKDGCPDDVMRIAIIDALHPTTLHSLRWGLNPSGYGTAEDPRRYICSMSCHPTSGMTIGSQWLTSAMLHGFPIQQITDRSKARQWASSQTWKDGMFTWVENGNNVGWASGGTYPVKSERWEGVIAAGTTGFTAIGGPTVGPYDNRYEFDSAPTGPFKHYYNPADRRIHMKSAKQAWLETDWDCNAAGDMKYTWTDTNNDGLLDRAAFDVDNNSSVDDQWDIATNQVQNLNYEWQAFHDFFTQVLQTHPAQLYDLDRSLAAALEAVQAGSSADAVWTFVENKYSNSSIPEWRRKKFLPQDNTLMYYLELVRDRQIVKLKSKATGSAYTSFWTTFNAARTTGDTNAMSSALRGKFGPASPNWTPFATWVANLRASTTKRVNYSAAWLPNGIAWETEKAAWRIQNGRFDFLGKRDVHYFGLASSNYKPLVLDGITASTDISKDSATAWGMDALIEGTGPGAGGLTLFVNNTAYPLYGDANNQTTYKLVEQTNDRVTVEMNIGKAGPAASPRSVRVRATAYAGHPETQFQAVIQGGAAGDKLELGIGLTRPADSKYENRLNDGILGIWGFQTPAIDWIGMGLIYPPAKFSKVAVAGSDITLVLKAAAGETIEWAIANDWRRGRRFCNFPVLANWMTELTRIAATMPFPVRTAAANWGAIQ